MGSMNSSKNKLNNKIKVRLGLDKNENYFTIQLIFAIYSTFSNNFLVSAK